MLADSTTRPLMSFSSDETSVSAPSAVEMTFFACELLFTAC